MSFSKRFYHLLLFLSYMKVIPHSLRVWFLIHFVIDFSLAIPLLIVPAPFLSWLGISPVDPHVARLVGAALIGIGGNSLLMHKKSVAHYLTMIDVKLLWSSAAVIGMLISLLQGGPIILWGVVAVFSLFFVLWWHYRTILS